MYKYEKSMLLALCDNIKLRTDNLISQIKRDMKEVRENGELSNQKA